MPYDIIVTEEDEYLHTPLDTDLWSESFYMDAVSDDATWGVYVRIGRTVNQNCSVYTAALCEKGKPAIMVVDQKAPLPPADDRLQAFKTKDIEVSFDLVTPLKAMRVKNAGLAASHEDHAEPLKGGAGKPVQAKFDLTWTTDGVPFHWRGTTRYELPCRVTGTIEVDGKVINFAGPGQRDHSWADRDWWQPSWTWIAFHLEDGTHMHAALISGPSFAGEGYVQKDGKLEEVTKVTSTWVKAADGLLVDESHITIEPQGLDIKVMPQGTGALLLTRDDGRASDFPRSWVKVETTDGRKGLGWIEWNWPRGLKSE